MTNVAYTILDTQLIVGPYLAGNAALNYSTPSYSWINGTLSYDFGSASGSASSPVGTAMIDRSFDTQLQITNTNNYGVEIPITVSLTYDGNSTSNAATAGSVEIINGSFDLGGTCSEGLPHSGLLTQCFTYMFPGLPPESITTNPFTITSDLFLPANTSENFSVLSDSYGEAEVTPVPEPSTFALLATGILGLTGAARRKFSRT
jgi:hypothetical protein